MENKRFAIGLALLLLFLSITAFGAPAPVVGNLPLTRATTADLLPSTEPSVHAAAIVVPYNGAVGGNHSVSLSWTPSVSAAGCSSTATPACSFGYNVYKGTAAGQESVTPINAAVISGTTFVDGSIVLGATPATYYYYVEAVETVGTVIAQSVPSNEVSATFPGQPAAPTAATVTSQN